MNACQISHKGPRKPQKKPDRSGGGMENDLRHTVVTSSIIWEPVHVGIQVLSKDNIIRPI